MTSQCQSYKSLKETNIQCPNKSKGPEYKYCGKHKNCKIDKINFTINSNNAINTIIANNRTERNPELAHMNMRKSLNKLNFDVIKSGLQKSIRRGLLQEAISYGIEGDLFSLVEEEGRAKGNRTNLMNRLRIILVEDLFDWQTILLVEPWFREWQKNRKTEASRKYFLSIINRLANSKKIRLLSDLKVYMFRNSYQKVLGNEYDELFEGWDECDEEKTDNMSRFIYLLMKKNPNCLYWYFKLYETGNDIFVWKEFDKLPITNKVLVRTIRALYELQSQLGKHHREKYLYTMAAIAFILYETMIDWSQCSLQTTTITDINADKLYKKHLLLTPADLPYGRAGWLNEDIVVDKHTMMGRVGGKTALDFAKVGCVVSNEDDTFLFPVLREVYLKKKFMEASPSRQKKEDAEDAEDEKEEKEEEKDEKEDILAGDDNGRIYGQKVTAGWKPMTFLTEKWIFKGPFVGKRINIPDNTISRFQKFRLYGDISAIPVEKSIINNQIYLKSPNIGEKWPPTTKVDKVKGDITGRVANRTSVGVYQGAELIKRGNMNWERFLYHFIVRYIIGAGDSGLFNYINNYGIDYEENRTHDKTEPANIIEVMFKKPQARLNKIEMERAINKYASYLRERLNCFVLPNTNDKKEIEKTNLVLRLLN